MPDEHSHGQDSRHTVRNWVFAGFLLVVGFFLLTEHQAHVFGALPYLLLLACPLMHFFGHGHGGHGKGKGTGSPEDHQH
ncbi:MAG: DUF2933 domain-containing protein [Proteobacteria bacterium]|nr:DUF2933 domain-containing protein [Pseudomonadota bacterium]